MFLLFLHREPQGSCGPVQSELWPQGQPVLQKAPAWPDGSRCGECPQRLQPVFHQLAQIPSSTRDPQEILEKIKEQLFVLKINATKAKLKGNNLLCAGHKPDLCVFALFFNGALCLQRQSGCHQHGAPWRRSSVYPPLADDRRPLLCTFVLMGPEMSIHGNTCRFKQQQTQRDTKLRPLGGPKVQIFSFPIVSDTQLQPAFGK